MNIANPMRFIREYVDFQNLDVLSESTEGGKTYKIKGPFLEAETKNKNGRVYPVKILSREVDLFNEQKIRTNRAMGELDHPPQPTVNLDRVSHIITELYMKNNIGIGCAKILDTPTGRTAQALLNAGVKLGVSTRGVGSLTGHTVNEDFKLITVDIVADPSAPSAFVEGILEGKQYIMDGDKIIEMAYENLEENLKNNGTRDLKRAIDSFLLSLHGKL
jgi:hypothetical protein